MGDAEVVAKLVRRHLDAMPGAPAAGRGNRLLRVAGDGLELGVRIPGRRRFVTTAAEYRNHRIAAAAGLAPACRYHDPASGAIAVDWLSQATPATLRGRASRGRCAALLARLHATAPPFQDRIGPRQALHWELARLRDTVLRRAGERAVARIEALPEAPPVNCHGDPAPGNLVELGDRMLLLDFEYSHRGHPAWDLAIVAASFALDDRDTTALLDDYRAARDGVAVAAADLAAFRDLVGVLNTAWELENAAEAVNPGPG